MLIHWTNSHMAGYLPMWLDDEDPRGAVEQIHDNYAHGGGWHDFEGFTLKDYTQVGGARLTYPNDPDTQEVSRAVLRDETVILFRHDWVAVVNNNTGAVRIARID